MGNQVHDGIYHDKQVNIPIQLLSITDRDGKITPLWFRLETEEHEIRKFRIEDIISRSEKFCRDKGKAVRLQDRAGRYAQNVRDEI